MEIVANSARDSDGVDFQGGKHEDAEWITSVPRERKHCAAILRHVGFQSLFLKVNCINSV